MYEIVVSVCLGGQEGQEGRFIHVVMRMKRKTAFDGRKVFVTERCLYHSRALIPKLARKLRREGCACDCSCHMCLLIKF